MQAELELTRKSNGNRLPISVIIPTYGRDQVLVNTVKSLLQLGPAPGEIILADQTPQHDSETECQLAAWQENDGIKWLRLPEPSIPHAMNQGLLAATGPLALFLDDDIVPDASLIEAHARAHAERPGDIVAGRVLQPWHDGQPDPLDRSPFGFNALEPRDVTEFMGGNFSLLRDAAIETGGFDENFVRVAYRFEAEFAYRWLMSGRKIVYEPRAIINHLRYREGGTRTFGEYRQSWKPDHPVGDYYYLLRCEGLPHRVGRFLTRPARAMVARHHLLRPWWIPATLVSEVTAMAWASILYMRKPKLLEQTRLSAR